LKVLLAHPGTQYSARLAQQLQRHSCLHRFWTGFALAQGSFGESIIGRVAPAVKRKIENRIVTGVPASKLRTIGWVDLKSRLKARRNSDVEAILHTRNRRFQEKVDSNDIAVSDVVIGFDTSSWILAERAKALGKMFVLDQSIAHPVTKEAIYRKLRHDYPDWQESLSRKLMTHLGEESYEHSLADAIVAPSHFAKSTLVDQGVDAAKIYVIPFGTDLSLFYPRDPSRGTSDRLVFIFVGALTARKGLPILLDAWRQLSSASAELWLVGDGHLPTAARDGLPPTVKLFGRRSRPEVAELLRRADVFVFPSFFEGLAQVQIEAAASGLPVIATRESGADDVIQPEKTGFILPAGDVEQLRACLERLISEPRLVDKMRQDAAAVRGKFSWERYGDRWVDCLERLKSAR
jgi:starch synthase